MKRSGVCVRASLVSLLLTMVAACGSDETAGPSGGSSAGGTGTGGAAGGSNGTAGTGGSSGGSTGGAVGTGGGSVLPPPDPAEWSQHAHDAQRSSFTTQVVEPPWVWKWAWNGPDSAGKVPSNHRRLPRNVQPVTGGGQVYVALGAEGVVALDLETGAEAWMRNPGGSIEATAAYDDSGSLYVVSTNGTLYRLSASSGDTTGSYALGAPSSHPPAIAGDRVYVSAGTRVVALARADLSESFTYEAGSVVQTPPAYSATKHRLVVGSEDLYVHAIDTADGTRAWRVKPSVHEPGSPFEFTYGWPVIAEAHGLVLMKMRLDWATLWTWSPWPTDNAQIRSNLEANPSQQALHVLDLDDGSVPFIANVGHGGYGDNDYMPMGPQPVVKRFGDGTEVVYTIGRGGGGTDGRWDSQFVELVLDDAISGFQPGYVRFIQYGGEGWGGTYGMPPTDEQPNPIVSGDQLLAAHWALGLGLRVGERSASYGTYENRISSTPLPHIVAQTSTSAGAYSATHYVDGPFGLEPDWRGVPLGFYVYYEPADNVYDEFWSTYATWVVSAGHVLFRACDGTIVCLGSAAASGSQTPQSLRLPSGSLLGSHESATPTLRLSVEAARAHVGKLASVEGRIAYLHNNGKNVMIAFQEPHQGSFVINIPKRAWPAFDALSGSAAHGGFGSRLGRNQERRFKPGQVIRATGRIGFYQGDPAIVADDPSAIRVVRR